MNLKDYWQSLDSEGKEALAAAAKIKKAYLAQIVCGFRQPSGQVARRLSEATDGAVSVHELRPDIFGKATEAA